MYRITVPATNSDLTTLEVVKRELGISPDSPPPDSPSLQDERLSDFISTASNLIANYCNRDTFGLQTYEQAEFLRRPCDGIVLAGDLNPTITSVSLNGTTLDTSAFVLDGSVLRRPILPWPHPESFWGWHGGQIVIVYTSGFNLPGGAPPALARAAQDIVYSFWASSTRDQTIRSEQVEGVGAMTYATSGLSALPIAPDRLIALARYTLPSLA